MPLTLSLAAGRTSSSKESLIVWMNSGKLSEDNNVNKMLVTQFYAAAEHL
jgi:hypothetical protein